MFPFLLALFLSLSPIDLMLETHVVMADEFTLYATLTIPLNPANRGAFLIWVSPDSTSGSSYTQLDEYTTKTRHRFSPRLYPGHYTFMGRLLQQVGGKIKSIDTVTQNVQIIAVTP